MKNLTELQNLLLKREIDSFDKEVQAALTALNTIFIKYGLLNEEVKSSNLISKEEFEELETYLKNFKILGTFYYSGNRLASRNQLGIVPEYLKKALLQKASQELLDKLDNISEIVENLGE